MISAQPHRHIPPSSWHFLTPSYDVCCTLTGLGKGFKAKVLRAGGALNNTTTVLDVGCGTGVFLELTHKMYPQATLIGIDPDEQALAIAHKRLADAKDSVRLVQAFAERLPLDAHSIDIAFSTLALHHMPDDAKEKALQEIYRVLKPKGEVVIADFGATKSVLMRLFAFLEHVEHMKGNFRGLIPHFLTQAGFHDIRNMGYHFPGIHIIKAQK